MKNKTNNNKPLDINSFNITDTQLTCNEFNNFHLLEFSRNIKQDKLPLVSSLLHNINPKTMFSKAFDEFQVKSLDSDNDAYFQFVFRKRCIF